jgi:uncharacterized protein YggU (UPF0235/DUF167 family)
MLKYCMSYLHVRATTGAKREFIKEMKINYFTVSVREKAERNMANDRIIKLVAEYFKVSVKKVKIINGHKSPSKLLVVDI